jgi:hypothetical protein
MFSVPSARVAYLQNNTQSLLGLIRDLLFLVFACVCVAPCVCVCVFVYLQSRFWESGIMILG